MERKRMIIGVILALCLILLAACSRSEDPGDHVFSTQTQALDKARELENTLNAADQTRREQIN